MDDETPGAIKWALQEYTRHLNEGADLPEHKLKVPETDDEVDAVHPLTKFRAACHVSFKNSMAADALIHTLEDCGLGLYAYAVSSDPEKRIIS